MTTDELLRAFNEVGGFQVSPDEALTTLLGDEIDLRRFVSDDSVTTPVSQAFSRIAHDLNLAQLLFELMQDHEDIEELFGRFGLSCLLVGITVGVVAGREAA